MKGESQRVRQLSRAGWIIAIILISTLVAILLSWHAPGLNLYARDRLMQARGPLSPPDDIVIVAIDEASIARYGRFPWPRKLTARVVDTISSAQPKAIAVDVLYSEPTESGDDAALSDAFKRAGNTIVAAQLIETTDEDGASHVKWLRPIASIEESAADVGHVNVSTESDGEARELNLRMADEAGDALWSIAVETIRVGDGARDQSVRDVPNGVRLGARTIPLAPEDYSVKPETRSGSTSILRPDRMLIDYVGPPGSFSHRTFSFADVLDGRVPAQSFRGKYVLIGATAATLGDHVASPFAHTEEAVGEQHGELMPGVEVLANAVNTILRSRFYYDMPDWLAALAAMLVAAAVLGALATAQGGFESTKQIGVLVGLLILILGASYIAFVYWLVVPPVVPALVSFVIAAPLALLRRSLVTSADLDERIAELTGAGELLLYSAEDAGATNNLNPDPAALIARLTRADAVAIYGCKSKAEVDYALIASHGVTTARTLNKDELQGAISLAQLAPPHSITQEDDIPEAESLLAKQPGGRAQGGQVTSPLIFHIEGADGSKGVLLLRQSPDDELRAETLRLCVEIAAAYLNRTGCEEGGMQRLSLSSTMKWHLPRGVEWKARALGILNRRLLARARFVDRALRSVRDGLIIADISGRIAFANPRAAEIFNLTERAVTGSNLFQRLKEIEHHAEDEQKLDRSAKEMLERLIIERLPFKREIVTDEASQRHYMLRVSPVTSGDEGAGQILGLIATLSDVTQQHELQEVKSDVMALITHELRTPLTAIQGMSELLAQFEIDAARRREMYLAINDEAKRLSRMINGYLDIARLESGARPLRLAPARLAALIERVLLLLDPLATQRDIRILRRIAPNLPAFFCDADLMAQAFTNLIANAVSYSPSKTEIMVEARASDDALVIQVEDQGYGIPADALPRIFEKFYRVPRLEDAETQGTGLGLALVREIVELHGGRVTVESEPGVGSTFSVRLPLTHKE